jgi:CRP/FNR family cyclic AMP-dependent transcriptional regulator
MKPCTVGLRRVRLVAGLEPEALEALAQQCAWRHCPAGRRILSREAGNHDVYMIVSGKVRVTAFSTVGRQVTFGDIGSGDWFGEFGAIDGRTRSADVDALEDTVLASMKPAVFRGLMDSHPVVRDRVLDRLVGLVRDLSERVFDFSTLGVQDRVYGELLRLAKQAGVADNTARIDPAPRHSELASKISTYREQVTRELSAMAKQGLLHRCDRALVIPDIARLEKIVAEVRGGG